LLQSDALNNKGVALAALGKCEEAIDCFDKVLRMNPHNELVLLNKGVLWPG